MPGSTAAICGDSVHAVARILLALILLHWSGLSAVSVAQQLNKTKLCFSSTDENGYIIQCMQENSMSIFVNNVSMISSKFPGATYYSAEFLVSSDIASLASLATSNFATEVLQYFNESVKYEWNFYLESTSLLPIHKLAKIVEIPLGASSRGSFPFCFSFVDKNISIICKDPNSSAVITIPISDGISQIILSFDFLVDPRAPDFLIVGYSTYSNLTLLYVDITNAEVIFRDSADYLSSKTIFGESTKVVISPTGDVLCNSALSGNTRDSDSYVVYCMSIIGRSDLSNQVFYAGYASPTGYASPADADRGDYFITGKNYSSLCLWCAVPISAEQSYPTLSVLCSPLDDPAAQQGQVIPTKILRNTGQISFSEIKSGLISDRIGIAYTANVSNQNTLYFYHGERFPDNGVFRWENRSIPNNTLTDITSSYGGQYFIAGWFDNSTSQAHLIASNPLTGALGEISSPAITPREDFHIKTTVHGHVCFFSRSMNRTSPSITIDCLSNYIKTDSGIESIYTLVDYVKFEIPICCSLSTPTTPNPEYKFKFVQFSEIGAVPAADPPSASSFTSSPSISPSRALAPSSTAPPSPQALSSSSSSPSPSPYIKSPSFSIPSSCIGLQPSTDWVCDGSKWVFQGDYTTLTSDTINVTLYINGNVTVASSVTLSVTASLNISGDLRLQANSSLRAPTDLFIKGDLVFSDGALLTIDENSTVVVESCINITNATLKVLVSETTTKTLLNYACRENDSKFSEVIGIATDPCDAVTTIENYSESQLSVSFTLTRGTNCLVEGLSTGVLAGIIAGAVAFVVLVVIVVLFAVKPVRKRVFPFRDRKRFSSSN